MADNINFLQQQQKQFAKRDKGDRWALIAVVGAASIVALIYGSLLYYQINLSKQIEAEKIISLKLTPVSCIVGTLIAQL